MPTQHDPSIAAAIAELHAAMAAVANGDVGPIKALYSHADDATSFYGWGGYEVGWLAIDQRWDWAAEQFKGGTVRHETLTVAASGDLFYATEVETFKCRMAGKPEPAEWSNRVTHIFRREAGRWRLMHRHANRLEGRYVPASRL